MDLDTFIIAVFCLVHEPIPRVSKGYRLRERGPAPQCLVCLLPTALCPLLPRAVWAAPDHVCAPSDESVAGQRTPVA